MREMCNSYLCFPFAFFISVCFFLLSGVFPQDEYPEEVSTDEDDDEMFGSRTRMKRGRGLGDEEEEEGGPAAKKKKGTANPLLKLL